MSPTCEETLAKGLWREGRRHRHALLRELEPEERRELLERTAAALPAERVTALLSSSVVAVGDVTSLDAGDLRELSIGDRDRLVLALRRLLHGEQLECVFGCRCGELLELTLDLGELLRPPGDSPPVTERTVRIGEDLALCVRVATGADHERAARRAQQDPVAARRELVADCIVSAQGGSGEPASIDEQALARAEEILGELDPGAEIVLGGACPACGNRVAATFDPITHLWAELEHERALLEHEVHVLALHYHWSEREIVGLDPARRARYLARLDRDLTRR
jgi:hypothetical protein